MSSPNSDESFNENLLDIYHTFQSLPPSSKTVDVYREWFNKRDHAHYTNEETIKKMTQDPKPMTDREASRYRLDEKREQDKLMGIIDEDD